MKTELFRKVRWMGWLLRRSGPYLALEILLPGGTVFALALYFYRRRQLALQAGAAPLAVETAGHALLRTGRAWLAALRPGIASAVAGVDATRLLLRLRATV